MTMATLSASWALSSSGRSAARASGPWRVTGDSQAAGRVLVLEAERRRERRRCGVRAAGRPVFQLTDLDLDDARRLSVTVQAARCVLGGRAGAGAGPPAAGPVPAPAPVPPPRRRGRPGQATTPPGAEPRGRGAQWRPAACPRGLRRRSPSLPSAVRCRSCQHPPSRSFLPAWLPVPRVASRSPGQVGGHRARCDAEHLRRARGVQVEEQPQRDDLPLPFRAAAAARP